MRDKLLVPICVLFIPTYSLADTNIVFDQQESIDNLINEFGQNIKEEKEIWTSNKEPKPYMWDIFISSDLYNWIPLIPDKYSSENREHYIGPPSSPKLEFWLQTRASCLGRSGYYNACLSGNLNYIIGGHENHPLPPIPPITNQPTGTIDILSGKPYYYKPVCYYKIPVNQYVSWYVKVPEYAARFEFKRELTGACSTVKFDTIDVRIQDLTDLAGAGIGYELIGRNKFHPENHYGKYKVLKKLQKIAWEYKQEFPQEKYPLYINDISLPWGGLFDCELTTKTPIQLANPWKPPHKYHRYGRQIDVRSWTIEHPKRFEEICCANGVQPLFEKGNIREILKNVDFSVFPSSGILTELFTKLLKGEDLNTIIKDIGYDIFLSDDYLSAILDRVVHYHLNFALDPEMGPIPEYEYEDPTQVCPSNPNFSGSTNFK